MKFTKEEAREKITEMFSKKVEKIDEWERTIKENVETLCDLLGEDSEIELDAFAEKAVKMLETQKGHINKANSTVAESLNKQIDELKKQIEKPAKKKKKAKQEDDDDDDGDAGKNETIAKLEERLKKLEDEKQAEEAKKTIGQKREQLAAEIKKKGVKNEKWVKSMLDKAKIDEIIRIIDKPVMLIDAQVKNYEEKKKEEKTEKINELFTSKEFPEWLKISLIFDKSWLNASTSMKQIEDNLDGWKNRISAELKGLQHFMYKFRGVILVQKHARHGKSDR